MTWIAFATGLAVALALVPAGLRALADAASLRENRAGRRIAFPAGVLIVACALVALLPLGAAQAVLARHGDGVVLAPEIRAWSLYLIGVCLLGLVDDLIGRSGAPGTPRGWRGHGRALLSGRASTGILKAVGAVSLAILALDDALGVGQATHDLRGIDALIGGTAGGPYSLVEFVSQSAGELALAVALLAATTNLLNLFDTAPGRAAKTLAVVAVVVSLGAWSLEPARQLAPFLGPVLVVAAYDLRGRTMLGDAGSNLLGGIAGIWMIVTLGTAAQAVALLVVLALSAYGEFRSLGASVERIPLVRHLDSLGRRSEGRSA